MDTVAFPLEGGLLAVLPKGANYRVTDTGDGTFTFEFFNFTGSISLTRKGHSCAAPAGSSPGKGALSNSQPPQKGDVIAGATDPDPDAAAFKALQDMFPDAPAGQLSTALRGTSGDLQKAVERVLKRQARQVEGGPLGGSAGKIRRGSLRSVGLTGPAPEVPVTSHAALAADSLATSSASAAVSHHKKVVTDDAPPPQVDVPKPWPAALRTPASPHLTTAAPLLQRSDPGDAWLLSPEGSTQADKTHDGPGARASAADRTDAPLCDPSSGEADAPASGATAAVAAAALQEPGVGAGGAAVPVVASPAKGGSARKSRAAAAAAAKSDVGSSAKGASGSASVATAGSKRLRSAEVSPSGDALAGLAHLLLPVPAGIAAAESSAAGQQQNARMRECEGH